jgi:hypothetical protein
MADASPFRNKASAALSLALIGAVTLGAGAAQAAEWWYVNQGQDRVMLIDVASIAPGTGRPSWPTGTPRSSPTAPMTACG